MVSIGKIKGKSLKAIVRNMVLTLFFRDKSKYYKFFQKRVEKNGMCKKYHYSELFGAFCNTKPYDAEIFENYIRRNDFHNRLQPYMCLAKRVW